MARPGAKEISTAKRPRLKGSYGEYAMGMLVEILTVCFFMLVAFLVGYIVLALYR